MPKRTSYEHRRSLLSLGEYLSENDSKKIVYLTRLPRDMATKLPWEVLTALDERGKANVEELTAIMKDIGREDVAKKVHELLTEDRVAEVMALRKSCEILTNKIEELKEVLNREGKRRIEKELSTALESVQTLHRSLKIASGLLINENLKYNVCDGQSNCTSLPSASPSSSPECTARSTSRNLVSSNGTHVVKGTTGTAPTIQCSTNITTTTSGTVISYENNYCSMAHSHQSPIQCSESKVTSESGAAKSKPVLLPKPQKKVQRQPNPCTENKVTNAQASSESGLVKPAQQKPDPLPKPQKKTHQLENKTANLPTTVKSEPVKPIRPKPNPLPKPQKKAHTGNDSSTAPTDDYSNTGDSGFVDNKEFLKEQQQQQTLRPPIASGSNPAYAKLTKATLETPDCHTYQSPNPGAVYINAPAAN